MKAFKIPFAKEIVEKRRFGAKKLKVGDTTVVDCSTGYFFPASLSIESSPKMTSGRKRSR